MGAIVMLLIGGVPAVGTWSGLMRSMAPLDGLVVDHEPESRTRTCGIVILNERSERTVVNADASACEVLRIGRRVHKDAWSLTYRADGRASWQKSPAEFWLGGVFGSLFMTAWVLALVWVLFPAWRGWRSRLSSPS